MMVEDRYFDHPATRRYTVDRYLDDLDKRYGGIDSVLTLPRYASENVPTLRRAVRQRLSRDILFPVPDSPSVPLIRLRGFQAL